MNKTHALERYTALCWHLQNCRQRRKPYTSIIMPAVTLQRRKLWNSIMLYYRRFGIQWKSF